MTEVKAGDTLWVIRAWAEPSAKSLQQITVTRVTAMKVYVTGIPWRTIERSDIEGYGYVCVGRGDVTPTIVGVTREAAINGRMAWLNEQASRLTREAEGMERRALRWLDVLREVTP